MSALRDDPIAPIVRAPFAEHPLRAFALNEIHARPFPVMATPRLVLHYAFMTDTLGAVEARDGMRQRAATMGVPPPEEGASHHVIERDGIRLRWETHAEFTTFTFDMAPPESAEAPLHDVFGPAFRAPGPLMVALRIDLAPDQRPMEELLRGLDPGSTAVSTFRDSRVLGATDFRVDWNGMTHILLVDRGLYPAEVGPLVQRVIELETYRTLALLGLPEARRLQPEIARIERDLKTCSDRMSGSAPPTLEANKAILDDLTQLTAELEAGAASSAFRFGASRAYAEIVKLRLAAVREGTIEGYSRWSSFLERRMAPAMRTCATVESRQAELSNRLERATGLLRTRIDVELEQQNRALLDQMNRRARMQLRLQQWVEGLSVAAVSYYVVGLIYYIARGVNNAGVDVSPEAVTAIAVIPVMLAIWLFVRMIRNRHGHDPDEGSHES